MTIQSSYIRHAIHAQLYRCWYTGYESTAYGIANMLNILDKNIIVKSGLGEAKGHIAYSERVAKLPTTWQNAHHIQSTEIDFADDVVIRVSEDRGEDDDHSVRRSIDIHALVVAIMNDGSFVRVFHRR